MQANRLHGDELITFLKQNQGGDRDALALDAGYFVMRHGVKSVERSQFLQAIAEAHGTPVGRQIKRKGARGKKLAYKVKVSPKGITPVGPGYTRQIGVKPGELLKVFIEDGVIVLEPENKESEQDINS